MTERSNRPEPGDDERRRTYLKASQMARDLGTHFLERMPLDDAAGALIAAGSSLMAAGIGHDMTAGYLRKLADDVEKLRAPDSMVN